eukprot:m.70830 g.70830  ORF g.70830 m.70830 type:complete len:177 (+) comp13792_c1_seq6:152-682(+)
MSTTEEEHMCCSHSHSISTEVEQGLDELEFERSLIGAASRNDLKAVKMLLDKGADPSQRSASGYTALHYFARKGNMEAVNLLLDRGADVNAATTMGRSTPLHRAVCAGNLAMIDLLVRRGADLTTADDEGQTALHKAATQREDVFQHVKTLLLQAGVDVHAADRRGNTAEMLKKPS